MSEESSRVDRSVDFLKSDLNETPDVGLILGSGLGELGDELDNSSSVVYADIPEFKASTVEGHRGQLVFGRLEDQSAAVMQGRFHYYEGHSMDDIAFPVRVLAGLGVSTVIVTNASGAVNRGFDVGDLVAIEDHINLMGDNPLIGERSGNGDSRFVDMTNAYDAELRRLAQQEADASGIELREGVYAANSGPSYETPAEIEMIRTLGADLVGMSTVPEVIAANYCDLRVLGLSCVTNMAAGVLDQPLNHDEVIAAADSAKEDFKLLVRRIVRSLEL
ncbi:MAG: purine-nucleoside phosphorylase [bacterium]